MKTMSVDEFHAALSAQGMHSPLNMAFICPMCGTVQSAADLIAAGAGKSFDEVERFLAFSCVGRWTGAGSPRAVPDGKPCNWTLGGLLSTHTLEVVTPDGKKHPRFQVASAEQAKAHLAGMA